MITSFTNGRVRLRHPALKIEENMQALTKALNGLPGVSSITANPRTGSALVLYDAAKLKREQFEAAETALCAELGINANVTCACTENLPEQLSINELKSLFLKGMSGKTENKCMGITLACCAGSLLFSTRLHALAGAAFLYFGARHTLRHVKL